MSESFSLLSVLLLDECGMPIRKAQVWIPAPESVSHVTRADHVTHVHFSVTNHHNLESTSYLDWVTEVLCCWGILQASSGDSPKACLDQLLIWILPFNTRINLYLKCTVVWIIPKHLNIVEKSICSSQKLFSFILWEKLWQNIDKPDEPGLVKKWVTAAIF